MVIQLMDLFMEFEMKSHHSDHKYLEELIHLLINGQESIHLLEIWKN